MRSARRRIFPAAKGESELGGRTMKRRAPEKSFVTASAGPTLKNSSSALVSSIRLKGGKAVVFFRFAAGRAFLFFDQRIVHQTEQLEITPVAAEHFELRFGAEP
jgi:hypothetical protein